MIKLVAFDWNGTILSDTNACVKANLAVLANYGKEPTNLKEFQKKYSVPYRLYWIRMGIDPKIYDRDVEKIQRIFFSNFEPLEKLCRTRSGLRDLLSWLRVSKIKAVIFSNHPIHDIKHQLFRLGIEKYFNKILATDPGKERMATHKRGKEDKIFFHVKENKFKYDEVLVVGDTDEEIEIGKRFGYYTVALAGGYQSTARLKAAKPDFLIHNLVDLKKIIQKLNK